MPTDLGLSRIRAEDIERPPNDIATVPASNRVLVTDGRATGQARSTLATVRALRMGGFSPAVTVSGTRSLAAASRDCQGWVRIPALPDRGYREAVKKELASQPHLTVVPTSDAAFASLRPESSSLIDKVWLARRARSCGLDPVPGEVFAGTTELRRCARDLDYPAVVKPVTGGWPAMTLQRPTDAEQVPEDGGALVVQHFVVGEMYSVSGVMWRSELVTAVHQRYVRTWPRDCGVSSYAETVAPDRTLEGAVEALLSSHEGVFQIQFRGGHVLDLNPRPYGSLPLAVAAGSNLPAIYCELLRGREPLVGRARVGVRYRWEEGDLRHVAQMVGDQHGGIWRAVTALLPRPRTTHSVVSIRDPAPLITRLNHILWRAGS